MDPIKFRERPEAKIQEAIIEFLEVRGWRCKPTIGTVYSAGWPDVYASHRIYGARWIEVKLPEMKGSKFTKYQLKEFPLFCANGAGVWVMTGATQFEYDKLFQAHNWHHYLKWN